MGIPQVFGVCISGGAEKVNTRGLWKTTAGRNRVTKSQHCYHWTWLGLPVLAAVVLLLMLGVFFWPLAVAFLLSLPAAVWLGISWAIMNGRGA